MRPALRNAVFSGIALFFIAFATSGCEPEFEDDICETDSDCFPDEECAEGRCQFVENECGGAEVFDNAVGDPCGPCNLDTYRCDPDDPDILECHPGDTECPELALVTTDVDNIEERSATLHGVVQEFPHEAEIVELGFCWNEGEGEPTPQEDTCASVDEIPDPEGSGEFSLDVDDLRPGTEHVVRAYSVTDVDSEDFGNEVDFITDAPVPQNVTTTSEPERVIVSWDEIDGAAGYEVRFNEDDGQLEDVDDPEVTSLYDMTAPSGSLGAPQNPQATTNEATGIQISWDAPDGIDGDDVTYEVAAVYPDAQSDYSDPVEGHRSAPELAGYELYVADDNGGDWITVGNSESFTDEEAPMAPLDPGTISASDGTSAEHVALQFENSPDVGEAPEQAYRIRTLYGPAETVGGESDEFTGRRGTTGVTDVQWYRGEDSDPSSFEEIDGAMDMTYEDTDPVAGQTYYYMAEVSAVESDPAETNIDSGYVAAGGAVADLQVSDITAYSAEVSAEVTSLGDPEGEEHGFCISTSPDPSYDDDDCVELGAPDIDEPQMSASFDDTLLDSGTTYYAVAFIHSDTWGTAYSAEQPFTTAPAAPEGLNADDGELDWSPSTGADEYWIYRDGSLIGDTEDTSFSDEEDLSPLAPVGVAASDDDAAQIHLQWQAPDSTDTVEYTVVAVIDPGATGSEKQSESSEPAFDDLPSPDHYEYRAQIEGADWSDWMDTSDLEIDFEDAEAAPTIDIGQLSASDDNPDGIDLDIDVVDDAPIEVEAGPEVHFEVRSLSGADMASDAVDTSGMRDDDDLSQHLTAEWQYEDDSSEWQTLTSISDINAPGHLDEEPDHEEPRTYRAVAQLQDIDDTVAESGEVTGTRGEEESNGNGNGDD